MEPENRDQENSDPAQPRPPRSVQTKCRNNANNFEGQKSLSCKFQTKRAETGLVMRYCTSQLSSVPNLTLVFLLFNQFLAEHDGVVISDMLRYAIEAGHDSQAVVEPEQVSALDPERRRFLEEAISSLTCDIVKELREAIETLKTLDSNTLSPETYENALDVIADHVDNLDAANDFVKLDGFSLLDKCLKSSHPGIRWRMADIVAQCTQNNPFCQNAILTLKVLEHLIHMTNEDPDERCRTKAFFAISNVVRDSAVGMKEFMRLNGFSAVKKAMKSDNKRLSNKATFFFSSVVSNHPNVIWDVVSMGFPEVLVSLLQGELDPSLQFVAESLLVLVQQSKEALTACRKKELGLEAILKRIIDENNSNESYNELVATSKELIKLVR